MDGPRSRGYGARSGYDVRTRCIRGCTERRQGVSPERIGHDTETARFCVGLVQRSTIQSNAKRLHSASVIPAVPAAQSVTTIAFIRIVSSVNLSLWWKCRE